jgi:hypothetical protein
MHLRKSRCRRVLQGPPTNADTPSSRALKDAPTIVIPPWIPSGSFVCRDVTLHYDQILEQR